MTQPPGIRLWTLGGTPVKAFAEQKGLSASNAAVRVFRAREALKKRVTESCGACAEHGCVDRRAVLYHVHNPIVLVPRFGHAERSVLRRACHADVLSCALRL